jgi:Fe-S-cluster containining protein
LPTRPILRPVVRSFTAREAKKAAAHARQGGHAVYWENESRARLVLPLPDDDDPMDLALWSVLDLGKLRYEVPRRGIFKGLATTLVPPDCHGIVRRRAERDRVHRGAKHTVHLDCLACGACCRENKVELDRTDIERFDAAGRSDLRKAPYARKKDGKVFLLLTRERACLHLRSDNCCGIYEMRPGMCRDFPMGSECCLSARAEELGIFDGARLAD